MEDFSIRFRGRKEYAEIEADGARCVEDFTIRFRGRKEAVTFAGDVGTLSPGNMK